MVDDFRLRIVSVFRNITLMRLRCLTMEDKQNISGERIRQARLQHELAQVELAAALNVDYGIKLEQSDISEIERQVRSLRDYELDAISKVLDIDPIWLLRGDH